MNSKILKNLKQQVLNYRPDVRDLPFLMQGVAIVILFGWLFYNSVFAVLVLFPMVVPWILIKKKYAMQQRCRMIGIQFKDAIFSALTSLKAGLSVENSFFEAKKDMELLYGRKSDIVIWLSRITQGLKNGIPLEKLILNMGMEVKNEDIENFARIFSVAKRSGGNMTEIIERTINVISHKINIEKEIEVLISAKRLEAHIMSVVPFFIIMYISLTSPGFFDGLYHNTFGIILMTVCLIVYCFSYLLTQRIVNISV